MHTPSVYRSSLLVVWLVASLLLSACTAASPTLVPPSSTSASPTPTGSSAPSAGATATPEPTDAPGTTYTVQGGDTLSSIARTWGTTIAQLQAWNGERYRSLAGDPDSLQAGWVLIVSGDPGATPRPPPAVTPAPTPRPPVGSGCRAGNRAAAGSPQTFYTVPGAGNGVALTFDMGGRLDPGVDILRFLIDHKVCATLFPTGAMAQTAEGQAIMAIVRAHPELFEVGNHTMHHCDLVRGGGGSPTTAPCVGGAPTAAFIRRELTDAAAVLKQQTGQDPAPYWRPPY
ncbi:MAG TPA: polysaccharide deacetylase family protein, partial [Candidatus Limnocylindrales bacterium]|nr:polysaccharide deacetylase family protein [Candidatus Limnocylindrales bacterium]